MTGLLTDFTSLLVENLFVQQSSVKGLLDSDQLLLQARVLVLLLFNNPLAVK